MPRAESKTVSRAAACRPRSRSSPTPRSATSASIVFGGKQGYLVNTRDLCSHTPVDQGRLHRPERQDPLAER